MKSVPVSQSRHGSLYWKRYTSYGFAAHRTECPVVLSEVMQAAAAFPIVFQHRGTCIEPVALLSLTADMPMPFVAADGSWLSQYVPSDLRCYPFRALPYPAGKSTQFQLCIDEASGLLSRDPQDEAFFDTAGKLTPTLRGVQRFFQAQAWAAQQTRALCAQIEELGLLKPCASHDKIALPPKTQRLDDARLAALPDSAKLDLFETGALALLQAHQVSLSHIAWLARAQQQISQKGYTENSDISGFLSAVANAQNDDSFGTYGV